MRRLAAVLVLLALSTSAAAGGELQPIRGLRAEVAALLLQGVAGGSLPVAAALFPALAPSGEAGGLAFLLELPPAPPVEAAGERPLEIYVYVVDGGGNVVAHRGWTLAHWTAAGEGVKLPGSLGAPAGDLSVRFLVWDPTARRYGLVVREVAAAASLTTPRFADECPDWTVTGEQLGELAELSARPVLVGGETRRLSLAGGAPEGGARVRLVRRRDNVTMAEEVAARPAGAGRLEFVVPELPPGIYQLSVVAGEAPGRQTPPLEVWLVAALPSPDGGCRRSWGRVLRAARDGELASRPEPGPAIREERPAARLAARYEALVGRLAVRRDLSAAARDLAELEAPVVGDDPSRGRLLFVTELKAARAVAERDPRCLLPLIALHAETYRAHHAAGRFPLATHSRRLAAAIGELAVELLDDPDERALVAVAIAGLADMVETRRASIEAQRLLERALSLDESQEAARLLLAVSYERKGRYADARTELETLAARNKAHHEARVRLAILLRRLGDTAEAERLLREVVAERPAAWLLSLAYQTLGQLLIRDARLSEAVSELEVARRRLPGDQVLAILQAYALDRSGERRALQRTLAELPAGKAAVTPRYRYSDEPAAELDLMHETLRQGVTVRLPLLAVALGAERGGAAAP